MRGWIVTPAIMTAAQTSTTLGSSGQSGSGVNWSTDALIPLGAVLVGALASLAGSVLVNRWQLRKTTRLEVWETILPAISRPWGRYRMYVRFEWSPLPSTQPIREQLSVLHRKVVLLKRRDKNTCDALDVAWRKCEVLRIELDPPSGPKEVEQQPKVDYGPLRKAEEDFNKKLWDYYYYVQKQLQPFHWRIVSLFSRSFRKRKRGVSTAVPTETSGVQSMNRGSE